MFLITALAVALAFEPTAPAMTVPAAGLDLSRPADAEVFAERVAAESRRFCAAHRAVITPDQASPPACERGMARLAVEGLPTPQWRRFVGAGGMRALSRRLP
jgi:UrcA family protein